jgi:cell division protein FtsW
MTSALLNQHKTLIKPMYDQTLLWALLILLAIGLVMVFSASIAIADASKNFGHNSHFFLMRQFVFIIIGLGAGFMTFNVPVAWWQKMAPSLFVIGIVLLILVLIPGIGRVVGGSRRWIPLFVLNLQPSEIMKVLVIIYVADYTIRKAALMNNIKQGFLPMLIVMFLVGALLILEPDYGAFVVITAICMAILWLGGMNIRIYVGLLLLLAFALVLLIKFATYRLDRLNTFLNGPWADPYGKGYQLTHALMAFGRGDWFGQGLGASVEKLHYLPEAHTDFVLAVIGEELGFIGVSVILALFMFIVIRAFKIAKEAIQLEKHFSALVAQGLGVWIGVQSFINISVNMGLAPTKGLTLPFLSYGGSSILANCIGMAILLRIDYENRRLFAGVTR